MKDSFSLQVGNLATGLCCRVGTRSPGARREEEEVLMIGMELLMLVTNNDVKFYLRRVECLQQWTALACEAQLFSLSCLARQ